MKGLREGKEINQSPRLSRSIEGNDFDMQNQTRWTRLSASNTITSSNLAVLTPAEDEQVGNICRNFQAEEMAKGNHQSDDCEKCNDEHQKSHDSGIRRLGGRDEEAVRSDIICDGITKDGEILREILTDKTSTVSVSSFDIKVTVQCQSRSD